MRNLYLAVLPAIILCLASCARAPRDKAEQGRLPAAETIHVAPFTQPVGVNELITGFIPEKQGRIPADMLPVLDRNLRNILAQESKHTYVRLPPFLKSPEMPTAFRTSEQPRALPYWIAYGRQTGARFLLIPQVLDWHERVGSDAGVTRAAHVRLEFFLLNVDSGALLGRAAYEEEQVGLVDDLLNVASFIRRRGTWVTADVLAEEGMRKGIKNLGL
jgi:hypothetical protein